MEKATLQTLRKLFNDNFSGIKYSLNNNLITWEGYTHNHLIWDDDNETLYMIRPNQSHYSQDKEPIEIVVTTYELIEQLISPSSFKSMMNVLDGLKAKGLIDDDRKEKIIDNMKDLQFNTLVKPQEYSTSKSVEGAPLGVGETLPTK